ncbi:hypothetical protein [Streptomyces albipurpureus]|uniref:Transposase n=1 Tax=Streptomyces albipurpureus TaxID=2897419 RepID=A0ABT0URA0_9ACTN|nr:hypothetical protein [Streptomyces sp. CWNU-1]MCM2390756.1 hypothetical protein [Streptomyces sp. CWNU-1]
MGGRTSSSAASTDTATKYGDEVQNPAKLLPPTSRDPPDRRITNNARLHAREIPSAAAPPGLTHPDPGTLPPGGTAADGVRVWLKTTMIIVLARKRVSYKIGIKKRVYQVYVSHQFRSCNVSNYWAKVTVPDSYMETKNT